MVETARDVLTEMIDEVRKACTYAVEKLRRKVIEESCGANCAGWGIRYMTEGRRRFAFLMPVSS